MVIFGHTFSFEVSKMKGKDKVIAIVTIIVIITAIAVIFGYADMNMER